MKTKLFIIYVLFIQGVFAQVLNVPNDYENIQLAIDATDDGDTVFVENGIYNEVLQINKSIAIIGNNVDSVVIKILYDDDNAIIIENTCNILLKSLQIYGRTDGIWVAGGNGIKISNSNDIVLVNLYSYGGNGSNSTCHSSSPFPAEDGGHGLFCDSSTNVSTNNCILSGGAAGTTDPLDPYCDPRKAQPGKSVMAINNSEINIYNTILSSAISNDSSSVINVIADTNGTINEKYIYSYSLNHNYPNPFNSYTNISFYLPKDAEISLKIYNSLGILVKKILGKERLAQGTHDYTFNSIGFASGVYLCVLESELGIKVNKMVILK